MSGAEVPLAVIGLGFMGARWVRALAEHDRARVRVVSDVREDLGREMASRLGALYVADARDAAAHPDVEGVAVCTPEHLHGAPTLAALEAGKAAMVEKPLANTLEEAERIRDEAVARGLPVLVGHILRFEPRYAAVRRTVASGRIGAVQAVRSERIGLVSDQGVLGGRTSVALYYGVHEFDLCRWYAGEVDRLWATRSAGVLERHGYPVEDLYSVGMAFADGAHGTAMVGWLLPEATPGWGLAGFTVFGEEGVLRVSQGDVGFLAVDREGAVDEDVFHSPEVHGRISGALATEADHFVRVVRGEIEPLCTAGDGVEAVRISLAMEEAAAGGEPVALRGGGP